MAFPARSTPLCSSLLLAFLCLPACSGGGGPDRSEALTAGDFLLTGVNVPDGAVWELNRPIRLQFNHPVDPESIGFQSIRIEPISAGVQGRPVTGSFEIEAGSGGRVVVFRPSCPTTETLDNGGFLHGGHEYQVALPTGSGFGTAVLRDTAGHLLARGDQRRFRTPVSPGETLFLDENPAPPRVTSIEWPRGLNLYSDPEPYLTIHFDQAIDGRSSNLNLSNLRVYYSLETVSSGQPPQFTELLPGSFALASNCGAGGAELRFLFSGLLLPDRSMIVEVGAGFRDIAGQQNTAPWRSEAHETPLLSEVYGAAVLGWSDDQETVDEFHDDFLDDRYLDVDAALALPPAELRDGAVHAGFDFPAAVLESDDLTLDESVEVDTSGTVTITGEGGKTFLVKNGVLKVDDLVIRSGVTMKGRGSNPLVILVQGSARIDGVIDVEGDDSSWPTSLCSPHFPLGPVAGNCGGGQGGMSSRITTSITPRGDSGDGPFGLTGIGGEGGEGGLQQNQNIGGIQSSPPHLISGGGGGGSLALTPNEAVVWDGWDGDQRPNAAENRKHDHQPGRHPYWPDGVWRDPALGPQLLPIPGGEDGLRGSSLDAIANYDPELLPPLAHGVYGMEDGLPDYVDPPDDQANFDPSWDGPTIPFDYGHPTNGPDGGRRGGSVFSADGDTRNDFWGSRINADGSLERGELLIPWAGSGGGASGDSFQVHRETDSFGTLLSVVKSWPLQPWPPNCNTSTYRKGAPGGGGGGQLQLLAIGPVVFGPAGSVSGNGGIGHGGEATIWTDHQVSGSGGGSGGHVIIHSASAIDLRELSIGSANNAGQLGDLDFADAVTAVGGRRGWAASYLTTIPGTNASDGNGDLMIGRGGAGGNGVVQFHVPDPGTDLLWPAAARPGILDYVHHGDPGSTPADPDRVEEVLRFFSRPQPYVCVPIFAPASQAQSVWIDTGLAGLREPAAGDGPFPDWADPALRFDGLEADGWVPRAGGRVDPLPELLRASQDRAVFTATSVVVSEASAVFAGMEHYLRTPPSLVGYDLLPNAGATLSSFEITTAEYDPVADELSLGTLVSDGSLLFAWDPGEDWALRPKFFRIDTLGLKDGLPSSAAVRIEFQGSDDPGDPGSTLPAANQWTADLAVLKGQRFLRYRVSFDIDAQGQGPSQASPKPALSYLKLPFVW